MLDIKVSVVLPIRFDNPFMEDSLQSTFNAMDKSMELIIVEDTIDKEAKDKVREFCENKGQLARILKITNEGDGLVDALHTGIRRAKGEYIGRMDADDICMEGRLRKQRDYLDAHPEIGLVSCLVKYGGDATRNPGFSRFVDWLNGLGSHESMFAKRYADVPVAHPSVMFRKTLTETANYRKHNEWGETVPEDFDLWLRWLNGGVKFAKIPEYLLTWNDLPERLSRKSMVYSKMAFWNSVAGNFANDRDKEYWICGYGKSVERRIRGLVKRGLTLSGYISPSPKIRRDGIPVITLEEAHRLKGKALILNCVANYEGKNFIQRYFTRHGFREVEDYLWLV